MPLNIIELGQVLIIGTHTCTYILYMGLYHELDEAAHGSSGGGM